MPRRAQAHADYQGLYRKPGALRLAASGVLDPQGGHMDNWRVRERRAILKR